uniref:DUF6715 family protein n=1 Tax=Acetatifactor sp. TaxID=1872090 RepID=UPI004055AB49
MKKATPKLIITFVVLLVLLVGVYAFLANKDRETKEEEGLSAVQETLSRNLQNDYPPTPKEVIKYYNEILKCFYNENASEEEIDDLGEKARELYDAELLEANELGTYIMKLHEDIQDYKENERKIVTAAVASSTNVDFFEEDGFEFARITCTYNIVEGEDSNITRQVYLLRKDENKQWKIYGWEDIANVELYQQEETVK